MTEAELLSWYFEERLGRSVPADAAAYARQLGLPDRGALVRTLLGEYCYLRLVESAPRASSSHR